MKLTGMALSKTSLYNMLGGLARNALKALPNRWVYNSLNAWGKQRNLPEVPKESFKDWYKKNRNS